MRLSSIKISDWGVEAQAIPIRNLIDDYVLEPWKISARWDVFCFHDNEWAASYVGWHIQFDNDLVNAVVDISNKYSGEEPSLRRAKIVYFISEYQLQEITSGRQL